MKLHHELATFLQKVLLEHSLQDLVFATLDIDSHEIHVALAELVKNGSDVAHVYSHPVFFRNSEDPICAIPIDDDPLASASPYPRTSTTSPVCSNRRIIIP